jgi:signal transduction histidine kinase
LKNWDYLPPIRAYADRESLLRVVGNYLSNAVKYAKTRIEVAIQKKEDGVLISVRDDGPGIPLDKLSLIFEHYYVVPGGKPGTGIGLACVKMIADLCKGRAWAESAHGSGCTFYFMLPMNRKEHDTGHT